MPQSRDPFPYPRFENDDTFLGDSKRYHIPHDSKPTHLAQKDDPWNRLNAGAKQSSKKQEAPQDSLDFRMKSTYNQHEDFLKSKNETLYQSETFNEDHGRILTNHVKEDPPQNNPEKIPFRMCVSGERLSIHRIKGTIEGPHSALTNRGYSRKHDGGFYCT